MKPISLGQTGGQIIPPNHLMIEVTEETALDTFLGKHDFCGGNIIKRATTPYHRILYCEGCGYRKIIPKNIITYRELCRWLKGK